MKTLILAKPSKKSQVRSIFSRFLSFLSLIVPLSGMATFALAKCSFRDSGGTCLSETIYGRCLLEVDGKTYLSGRCAINLDMHKGVPTGDFSIGTDGKSDYFAYVNDSGRSATWNDGASHAHTPLGTLTKKGACWVNSHTKVCAWR